MSFAPPPSVPMLSRGEMIAINDALTPLAKDLRSWHAKWRDRVLIRHLKPAESAVLVAVASRTLGWGKLLEVIPLRQLTDGLCDAYGAPVMSEGIPAFLGTGLDKKTVMKALSRLEYAGMLTRLKFPSGGRETYAYMPISAWVLRELLARRPQHGSMPNSIRAALRVDADGAQIVTGLEEQFLACMIREPAPLDDPSEWFETA